jgi:hypothetical protein
LDKKEKDLYISTYLLTNKMSKEYPKNGKSTLDIINEYLTIKPNGGRIIKEPNTYWYHEDEYSDLEGAFNLALEEINKLRKGDKK